MSLDKKEFLAELETQRIKHHDELAKLTAALAQAQAENAKLQREHDERVKAIERKWHEERAHFQTERDAYRGELNKLRIEIATLKGQLDRQVCRVSNLMYPGPWPATTNADERTANAKGNLVNAFLVEGDSFAGVGLVNGLQEALGDPQMAVPKDEAPEVHNGSASAGGRAPPREDDHMDVVDDHPEKQPPQASTAKPKSKQQSKSQKKTESDNEIECVGPKAAPQHPPLASQRPVRLRKPTERAAKIEHVEPRLSNRAIVSIPKSKQTTSPPFASSSKKPLAANKTPGPLTYTPTDAAAQLDLPNREFTIHLSPEFVAQCLRDLRPFKILPPLAPSVPRRFLRETYGGSDQHFLQFIPADRDPSRATSNLSFWSSSSAAQLPPRSSHSKGRPIVFPGADYNQHMPQEPGYPGLVFNSTQELTRNGPWSLFRKDPASKAAVWTYLGEYESQLAAPVGGNEFRRQPHSVKVAWAGGNIITAKAGSYWARACARIAVRKAHAVGSSKILSKTEADAEVEKLREEGKTLPLSIADVIDALDRGDEGILLVKMQCVGYDRIFANDIATKYAVWDSTAKPKTPKTLKRKGEPLAKSSAGNNKLAKRAESDNEEDEEEDEERNERLDRDGPPSPAISISSSTAGPSASAPVRRSGRMRVSLEGNNLGSGNGGWWGKKMDEDGFDEDAVVVEADDGNGDYRSA